MCVRGIRPEMHGQSSGGATLAEVKSSLPGMHAKLRGGRPSRLDSPTSRQASIHFIAHQGLWCVAVLLCVRGSCRVHVACRVSECAAVVRVPTCRHFWVVSGGLTQSVAICHYQTLAANIGSSAKIVCGIDRCGWTC